nr:uncharacterized protein LOC109182300 [Ipomoea batatas]
MAAKQEPKVSLKLLIDEKTNRLVGAEAHKDLVDILFSFLTLPMATVIRVTKSVTIGCMNNLYHSIQNIGAENDLQIRPASPNVLDQLLSGLGLSEMNQIKEIPVEVSKEQVICLLARSLVSKSPLSDVFLPNHGATSIHANPDRILPSSTGIGCIDNLYGSLAELDVKWFGSADVKSDILLPGIATHHNCTMQPLNLVEREGVYNMVNPKNHYCSNFCVEPSVFIVSRDLEVKSLSFASSFGVLRDAKVALSDTEDQVIAVGMKEALCLLKAALTSPSSALTNGFNSFVQKQKA